MHDALTKGPDRHGDMYMPECFHNHIEPIKLNLTGKSINTNVFEELEIIEIIPNAH